MEAKSKFFSMVILPLVVMMVLSCTLMSPTPEAEQPDPSVAETEIQLRVIATSLAIQQMTLDAAQVQLTQQVPVPQPTQTSAPPQPTAQVVPPSPIPSPTVPPPPAELVLSVETSVKTFYCYQPPYEMTITVKVSDINRGMAVYYHIRDKNTGVQSDGQVIDLHRQTGDTRTATIIGGGSSRQNLQFPPMMGESFFVYQVITDDGKYRTPAYSNVTFHPCGQ